MQEAGVSDRPRSSSKSRIEKLDRALARDPDAFAARFERAGLHREQGAYEAAKADYLELLRRRPTDFGVLNDFGNLVLTAGYKDAARSLFGEAVRHHPDNPMGRVNLATLLFLLDEHDAARTHFEAALRADPDHIHAHRGMGNLLAEIGDEAGARAHRDRGFKSNFLTTLPYRGVRPPVRVLLLVSAAGGNTPTASLLDEQVFQTSVLVTEYYDVKVALPAHDVVFNSIGDADICAEGLDAAGGVRFHTGRYFTRVESPESLAAAASELPGDDVWLIEQLDARDGEGMFRKIRVMIVDPKLYPLHLAISRAWMFHYFPADL